MTTTAIQNRPAAETAQALSDKVSQQVSEILADVQSRESPQSIVRPAVAYRIPAPGVRYYF